MVCNRSLYCWKNGPCASDEARKQIWEDNIKFRKNLRDANLSDHYWSFQISQNLCLCIEGEDSFYARQPLKKYKSGSLQKLHEIDCASITHDCNGLKYRNCYIHCPKQHSIKNDQRKDAPMPETPLPKRDMATSTRYSYSSLKLPKKSKDEKSEFCHRYKNTLSDSCLKPCTRIKFPSQLNLASGNKNFGTVEKKIMHSSCENILSASDHNHKSDNKEVINSKEKNARTQQRGKDFSNDELETKKEDKNLKENKVKPKTLQYYHGYTPVSKTTRKMFYSDKKLPFVTFGCNNNNNDIGSKKTHNVLASAMEVYPNALTAKQHKKDMILKYLENEKDFQKKCFPEHLNKVRTNHSSLWYNESLGKEKLKPQKKNTSNVLPLMRSHPSKIKQDTCKVDSYPYKTYRKPQINFY